MRSVLLLLLIGMLTTACAAHEATAAAPLASTSHIADAADLASKTVALTTVRHGDVGAYCSGVWVGHTTILTANHCVADLELNERLEYVVRSDVLSDEGREFVTIHTRGAMLTARDEGHDLALLYAPLPPSHGVASVSAAPVRPGMAVQAMGMPLGLWYSYSTGDVAAIRELESHGKNIRFIQTTAPISGGSSGGGLFDAMGDLVGICHGTFTRGQNLNLFIHWQYIGALLHVQGKF